MPIDQKIFKGLGVYKFNWVLKNKLSIENQIMSTNYLASGIKIDEKVYKILKDLYRFKLFRNKLIYDNKVDNIIGKIYRTKLSPQPIFVLSKQWIKQELYRTQSPTIRKIIEDSVLLQDIMPDYLEHLHQKHLDAMKYWHNTTRFHIMEEDKHEHNEIG